MFDFNPHRITKLSKSQKRMTHKKCHKCGVSLPIIGGSFFCLKCKVIAKKERNTKKKLAKFTTLFGA